MCARALIEHIIWATSVATGRVAHDWKKGGRRHTPRFTQTDQGNMDERSEDTTGTRTHALTPT